MQKIHETCIIYKNLYKSLKKFLESDTFHSIHTNHETAFAVVVLNLVSTSTYYNIQKFTDTSLRTDKEDASLVMQNTSLVSFTLFYCE